MASYDTLLPDDMLARIHGRAATYDRENRFCDEDLAELREHGYLRAFVPERLGGRGLSLQQIGWLQRKLAAAAPATALAVNMHHLCVGVAKAMNDRGDSSFDFVFDETMAGELFAFGISEAGNDWVLNGSKTIADRQPDGGYLFTGTKIFTSLSPAWTKIIVHGLDSGGDEPELVYGFLDRDAGGIEVSDEWDVLGMRASHSRSTRLKQVAMRPERVVRRIPTGPVNDLLVFAIASNFQLLVGSVNAGLARRALEVAAEGLQARHSAKAEAHLSEVPEYRARLAATHMRVVQAEAQLDAHTRDVDELADHGAQWPLRLISARIAAVDAARDAAATALACAGGRGFGNAHEASRLLRDANAGIFHPPGYEAALPGFAEALLDE